MASPIPKRRKHTPSPLKPSARLPSNSANVPAPVDPIWLLKGFALTVLAALVCGYLSLCLLFYQGQWQFVLHPTRSTEIPRVIAGDPVQIIHFGVDESATPQLTGWYLPAEPMGRYDAYTVLYLPGGDGSLADPHSNAQPTLAALHSLGLNLFAFDYRGYGQSADIHPNQQRMAEDAVSAWNYLTVSRALAPGHIILYGDGVGGFLAAELAAKHREVPALILDSPRPNLLEVVLADPRVKSLPVRALFRNRFDIAQSVATLPTPKLFLLPDFRNNLLTDQPSKPTPQQLESLTSGAASPKMIVHLPSSDAAGKLFSDQISRFLGEYLQ